MRAFLIRRALMSLVTLVAVSMIVFMLARIQGDPRAVMLSDYTTNEQYEAWGREMGLDKPIAIQYVVYMGKVVTGDLGDSLLQHGTSVGTLLWRRIPNTVQLSIAAFMFSLIIGIPLGVLAAVTRASVWDYSARAFAIFGHSAPSFWVGLIFIVLFAVELGWFPTSRNDDGWKSLVLPSLALGWGAAGGILRLMRSAMLEVLDSEYVKLAKAKGMSSAQVVWKHAFRNALIAPLTAAGLLFAGLITGTVVTESVFAWPGLGLLAIQAVNKSDYPVLQGVILLVTVIYVITALAVDLLYAYIDPRIKYT